MCQLLGMNCAAPTDFGFSFRGFCRRGGHTDIHSHGWGLAIYEGKGLRTFLDPLPAAESPVAAASISVSHKDLQHDGTHSLCHTRQRVFRKRASLSTRNGV